MLELQKLHRGPDSGPPPLLRDVYGAVLRRERRRQRRTLDDVASRAGVSLQYLSEIERGRKEASSEILAAVCASLGSGLAAFLAAVHRELAAAEGRAVLHLQSAPSASRPTGRARQELAGGETPPADADCSGLGGSTSALPPLPQGVASGRPAYRGLQYVDAAGLRSVGLADRGLQYIDADDLLAGVLADPDLAPHAPADARGDLERGAQGGPPAILRAA